MSEGSDDATQTDDTCSSPQVSIRLSDDPRPADQVTPTGWKPPGEGFAYLSSASTVDTLVEIFQRSEEERRRSRNDMGFEHMVDVLKISADALGLRGLADVTRSGQCLVMSDSGLDRALTVYHGSAAQVIRKKLAGHSDPNLQRLAETPDGTTCVGFFGTRMWYGRTIYEYWRMIDMRYLEFILREYYELNKARMCSQPVMKRAMLGALMPEIPRTGSRVGGVVVHTPIPEASRRRDRSQSQIRTTKRSPHKNDGSQKGT